jgi:WD40 repeat protein
MRSVVLLALASAACWRTKLDYAMLRIEPLRATQPVACSPTRLAPATAPNIKTRGQVRIQSVQGERAFAVDGTEAVAWSNDGRRVAVGEFGLVEIWSAEGNLEQVVHLEKPHYTPGTLRWATDDHSLLVSEEREAIFGANTVVPLAPSAAARSLRFVSTRDGERPRLAPRVLARSPRATLELAPPDDVLPDDDVRRLFPEHAIRAPLHLRSARGCSVLGRGTPQTRVAFSADSATILIGDYDDEGIESLRVHDAETGALIRGWRVHGAERIVASSPERAVVLVGGGLRAMDLARGSLGPYRVAPDVQDDLDGDFTFLVVRRNLYRPGGEIGEIFAARDGSFLLGESQFFGQAISLWHLDGPGPSRRFNIGRVLERIALSPDERSFAVGTSSGAVEVRDRETGRTLAELSFPTAIRALAFSRDGRYIAAAARDGGVLVHSLLTNTTTGSLTLEADRGELLTWIDESTLIVDTLRGQTVTVRIDLPGAP